MERQPAEPSDAAGGRARRGRAPALALALAVATLLWLAAWGRLGYAALAQPSIWQESRWYRADGRPIADPTDYRCRLNAFQQGELVYRFCDGRDGGTYLVVFDPPRRTATVRWTLPESFRGPDWFEGFALGPQGELTILATIFSNERGGITRLLPDGTIGEIPPPDIRGIVYGFGWLNGELALVYADSREPGGDAWLVRHRPGVGWSAPGRLPGPACDPEATCALLVAIPTPEGWARHYASTPRRPANPERLDVTILRADEGGAARAVQRLAIPANPRIYSIADGQVVWVAIPADRSAGNMLNYGSRPQLRQGADGNFALLPTLSPLIFPQRQGGGRETGVFLEPQYSPLTSSYRVADNRLYWQPAYAPRGEALAIERAVLLDDRLIVVRDLPAGIVLEEWADPTASIRGDRALVLGRQSEYSVYSAYTAPLLRAPDGTYWLVGRYGNLVHAGADLRRLDPRDLPTRLRFFLGGVPGYDDFHDSLGWLKTALFGVILFGWPPLALGLLLRRRRVGAGAGPARGGLLRPALAYSAIALLGAPWFLTAAAYF